jgi:RHS repeat-associated protein
VTCLLDAQNGVVARYRYDPFGNLLGLAGPLAEANLYRFSSKEFHASSGLYYYGYRFYEPRLQRWLNADPIGEAGGKNLYLFAGNDPADAIDPYGQEAGFTYRPDGGMENYFTRKCNPPRDPVSAAADWVGFSDYDQWNPMEVPKWLAKTKCNKFVGDCISECPNRPRPLVRPPGARKLRYPTAAEWADPNMRIPGYGPPHRPPRPGDVVCDGIHVGFMSDGGYIEAPTHGPVKILPLNNRIWTPSNGRTPVAEE